MFCANCGKDIAKGKAFCTSCGAPVGQSSEAAAPAPGSLPEGLPVKPKRTGLIVGSVVAAIIVLAGAGVGIWLAVRGDDGGASAAGATATTAAGGLSPFETIPSLDGPTDTTAGGPGTTLSEADMVIEYVIAAENLAAEMDFQHGRIPELAEIINDTLPDVPQPVYDELDTMASALDRVSAEVVRQGIPQGYESSNYWLMEATMHMNNRIRATMDGIQAAWDAGSSGAARPFFDTGRTERDAYIDAIAEYYAACATGT